MEKSEGIIGEVGNRDYVADLHENKRTSDAIPAAVLSEGDVKEFGVVTAVTSGLPLFNKVFVFESPAAEHLVDAIDWMENGGHEFSVMVSGGVLAEVTDLLSEFGFESTHSEPGMVLETLDEIPSNNTYATFYEAKRAKALKEYASIFATAFGAPLEPTENAFLPFEACEGGDLRIFLGEMNGESAAGGILVQTNDVAGVYGIAVREAFRRRGIGEAVTWEVLRAGKEAGCEIGVLLSTEMGYPLYEKMGFETVVTYHQFEPVA